MFAGLTLPELIERGVSMDNLRRIYRHEDHEFFRRLADIWREHPPVRQCRMKKVRLPNSGARRPPA